MKALAQGSELRHRRFLFAIGAEIRGPYSVEALHQLAASGVITQGTPLALEGSADFKIARDWDFAPALFLRTKAMRRVCADGLLSAPDASQSASLECNATTTSPGAPRDETGAKALFPDVRARHVASEDELNARLARDPNDPLVVGILGDLRERMRKEKRSAKEMLRVYFSENRRLNTKLSTAPGESRPRFSLEAQAHHTMVATAALGFSFILIGCMVAGSRIERMIAGIAMGAVGALMVALYIWGLRWQRWIDVHPVVLFFLSLGSAFTGGFFLFATVIWVAKPFLSYGDVLHLLLSPLIDGLRDAIGPIFTE